MEEEGEGRSLYAGLPCVYIIRHTEEIGHRYANTTRLCVYVKTYWKGPQETKGFSREQGLGCWDMDGKATCFSRNK